MFQSRPGFARVASLAVAGMGCLALAACSTSPTSGSTASTAAAPSPSATADPLASLTAAQVAVKVIADAKAASSLTLVGVTDSGEPANLNLVLKPGQGCTGTIASTNKGSFKLLVIGDTVYMNPDKRFWESSGGSQASTVIALVNGRWLKTTKSDKNVGSILNICDVSQMFSTNGKQDKLTKGTVTTLNGTRVLTLKDAQQGTVYVTDTSNPELVEMVSPKDTPGGSKVTVTYGAPVKLTAPPASEVIDGAPLGI